MRLFIIKKIVLPLRKWVDGRFLIGHSIFLVIGAFITITTHFVNDIIHICSIVLVLWLYPYFLSSFFTFPRTEAWIQNMSSWSRRQKFWYKAAINTVALLTVIWGFYLYFPLEHIYCTGEELTSTQKSVIKRTVGTYLPNSPSILGPYLVYPPVVVDITVRLGLLGGLAYGVTQIKGALLSPGKAGSMYLKMTKGGLILGGIIIDQLWLKLPPLQIPRSYGTPARSLGSPYFERSLNTDLIKGQIDILRKHGKLYDLRIKESSKFPQFRDLRPFYIAEKNAITFTIKHLKNIVKNQDLLRVDRTEETYLYRLLTHILLLPIFYKTFPALRKWIDEPEDPFL
jgi:hypothetical protein